jgi:hypothetical protein
VTALGGSGQQKDHSRKAPLENTQHFQVVKILPVYPGIILGQHCPHTIEDPEAKAGISHGYRIN